MKKIISILLIGIILACGCTSQGNQKSDVNKNLNFNDLSKVKDLAYFENEGNSFSASLDRIEVSQRGSYIHDIKVYMTIHNTGKKAISFVAYSSLTDYAGVFHQGGGTSFGLVYPGDSYKGDDGFTISSNKEYEALLKGATLNVEFSGPEQTSYDASWIIDLKKPAMVSTSPDGKIDVFLGRVGTT